MNTETIDLYKYFGKVRGKANGGYLTVYARSESAEVKRRIRPVALIFPGGGYKTISDREGEPVALKYLDSGFVSFVLSYSVETPYPLPLVEAMLAVMYIRDNAEKYNADKDKLCAVGYSAGGHLAGLLSTVKKSEAESVGRNVNDLRPNAVIYAYPVVSLVEHTHICTRDIITGEDASLYDKLSVENRIDGNSAPAFIWHTYEDDCVPVENSLMLANAYRKNNIPFNLHIFERGWHGLVLCDDETNDFSENQKHIYAIGQWLVLSFDWLCSRGFTMKKL